MDIYTLAIHWLFPRGQFRLPRKLDESKTDLNERTFLWRLETFSTADVSQAMA